MKHYKTIQIDGKQVRLHRYLMEQKLKRKLSFNEVVHHVNGDKFDNRIENLEVLSRSEHMKKHPEILEKWKEKNTHNLDMDKIIDMYKTMKIKTIAGKIGVSAMTIWYRLKKHGIKTTKIDSNDVVEIKILISKGVKQKEIANQFNVSIQTISNIKTNRRYGKK